MTFESGPGRAAEAMRIVIADANFHPHRALMEELLPGGAVVAWHPAFDEAAVRRDLPGAAVYVGPRFTRAMADAAEGLRLVHVGGAGHDGIDLTALPPGVSCANTFRHETSIAEYVAATGIMVRRQLLAQDRALRQGRWASSVYEPHRPQPSTLAGATLGIVGYGHIGRETWRVMRSFGVRGIAVTRRPPDAAAEGLAWIGPMTGLDRLLGESDLVVLCLPLSSETRHLIDARRLALMTRDAVLINVGRGPLVDAAALHAALAERRIGGAVIDVWYSYPTAGAHAAPSDVDFGALDNVLLTPHVSGVTRQTFEGRVRDVADNIRRLHAGLPLVNVVHAG
ncbi:2-hydroxyacid dehydrogenase [Methylobacterium sp. JK268]